MSDKEKKQKTGMAFAIWIVAAILILILYLVNREKILYSLKVTDFFGKVFDSEPEFITNYTIKDTDEPLAEFEHISELEQLSNQGADTKKPITFEFGDSSKANAAVQQDSTTPKQETSPKQDAAVPKTETVPAAKTEPEQTVATMDQHLFFIEISSDGSVLRKEVVRKINKTNTPLTVAINALLDGPDVLDIGSGYMTLIPIGTRLLGASVKNGVATLDFSEHFLYNKYGVEGFYGQLMQIVYTGTAFSNVESVQILIEGKKQDYLGSEGVYIGSPLPRSSFR